MFEWIRAKLDWDAKLRLEAIRDEITRLINSMYLRQMEYARLQGGTVIIEDQTQTDSEMVEITTRIKESKGIIGFERMLRIIQRMGPGHGLPTIETAIGWLERMLVSVDEEIRNIHARHDFFAVLFFGAVSAVLAFAAVVVPILIEVVKYLLK